MKCAASKGFSVYLLKNPYPFYVSQGFFSTRIFLIVAPEFSKKILAIKRVQSVKKSGNAIQ